MKIKYTMSANLLRQQIRSESEAAGITIEEAIRSWAQRRFAEWAERNELNPPSITSASTSSVDLECTAATGERFLREIGGREIGGE